VQRQQGLHVAFVAQEPCCRRTPPCSSRCAPAWPTSSPWSTTTRTAEGDLDPAGPDRGARRLELEQRVDETLHRLHLDPEARIGTLSGGNRKRVALAQALVRRPDVLLLDEPTNHLDLDSIEWLENLLLDFRGSVVLITHDRAFLDRVATRIVELDRGRCSPIPATSRSTRR
jgi:ATP-binding cassette subfamily F protein uup